MAKQDIEKIWTHQTSENEKIFYSLEKLRTFRNSYSSKITLSRVRLLLCDSVYKTVVLAGYILLLFLEKVTFFKAGVTLLVSGVLLMLIINNSQLKKEMYKLDSSKDVIGVLKEQYKLLKRFYREFLLIGSITHPLFVLGGFQFYHLLKYKDSSLIKLITDPVTLIFLFLAFLVPFVTHYAQFKSELKELERIIDIDVDEVSSKLELIRIKERKKVRFIIFFLIFLSGILALLIVLNLSI